MAQHDYVIANQGFPAFRSDLNDALAAIVSNNSGATEPTTMFAHQMWVDTAADPSVLKIRNADNDAWITIGTINQTGDTFTLTSAVSATTLNTSGAVVFNDAGADVDFRVEGDTNQNLLFVDASREAVGVGVAPSAWGLGLGLVGLDIGAAGHLLGTGATVNSGANCYYDGSAWKYKTSTYANYYEQNSSNTGAHAWFIAPSGTAGNTATFTQAMTLDASGNLLVGTTDPLPVTNNDISGIALRADGNAQFSRSGVATARFNRGSTDGDIVSFHKDGTQVGAIGVISSNNLYIANPADGLGLGIGEDNWYATNGSGTASDNTVDLGDLSVRFDDVYATNGTIQTSDRNEKQDIEALSEAETRVAVAAKGLLKKYRWKSAVAEKGDDARIHFGIIAQDLKAAFEAEGLDAGRYAMFIYSEWWETQTEIPAVEAQEAVYETQTDEEGNEVQVLVSEAVEGKDAYTRTDTYETEAEAPDGAVRKERMGVRYNELLAFIIAAI